MELSMLNYNLMVSGIIIPIVICIVLIIYCYIIVHQKDNLADAYKSIMGDLRDTSKININLTARNNTLEEKAKELDDLKYEYECLEGRYKVAEDLCQKLNIKLVDRVKEEPKKEEDDNKNWHCDIRFTNDYVIGLKQMNNKKECSFPLLLHLQLLLR